MKKKLISTLMVSIFLFVVGINEVRADDPAGESVAPTGQSLPAGEADDSTPPSENVNPTGQTIEAPPVEDNTGNNGENVNIQPKSEEASPVQLVEITTEDGKFDLLGIEGTVKEKEYTKDCGGNLSFLVLTTDSNLYYGYLENAYPNKYPSTVQMKKVKKDSNIKISELTYTHGGIGCSRPVLKVRLSNNTLKEIDYNDTTSEYVLDDEYVKTPELIKIMIENKKYYLPIFDTTESTIKQSKIKETKYAHDCGGNLYIIVLTDNLKIYAGKYDDYYETNIIDTSIVSNNVSSKVIGFTRYDGVDYAKKTNQKSYCMANLGVKFANRKIYSLQYDEKTGYYLDTKNECVLEESTTTLTNKDTNIKAILSSDEKNFNSNSTISVKIFNNNEEQYKKFETAVKKLIGKYSKIKLFDIYLTNSNNEAIQPSSTVKVIIPVPEGYDKNRIAIYHLKNNGDLEKIKSTIEDENIVFETNHFSLYGIVENNKQGLITNPKTGNYISYTFGLLFVVISGIGIFALKNRKLFNK